MSICMRSAFSISPGNRSMWGWIKREPDFIVGVEENPYLLRWHVIPRNRFFNIYLHKFLRDDDDRAHHDHPWPSMSLASDDYMEFITPPSGWNDRYIVRRRAFRPVFRKATHIHRILLFKDSNRKPIPFWTLFITGKNVREWGFHCPKGFIHWKDFCDETDHGNVGRGCE